MWRGAAGKTPGPRHCATTKSTLCEPAEQRFSVRWVLSGNEVSAAANLVVISRVNSITNGFGFDFFFGFVAFTHSR